MSFLIGGIAFLEQLMGQAVALAFIAATCALSAAILVWSVSAMLGPTAKKQSGLKFLTTNLVFYVSLAALCMAKPDNLSGLESFGFFLLCVVAWWPMIAFVTAWALSSDDAWQAETFSG